MPGTGGGYCPGRGLDVRRGGDVDDFDVHHARQTPAAGCTAAEDPLGIVQAAVLDDSGELGVVGDLIELLRDDQVEQRIGDRRVELRALVRLELVECGAV